jgi:DNA-binding GntR family transcriptional regulator
MQGAKQQTRKTARKPLRLETAHQSIKHDILHCTLLPGSYVSEPMLAARYGTGRSAVRAAMNRLVQEQLVASANKKLGYQIAQLTLKDVQELYATRLLLETHTVSEAAERMNKTDLETLNKLATIKNKPGNAKSVEAYLDTNEQFHLTIAQAAGNAYLTGLLSSLMERMAWIQHLIHMVTLKSYSPNDGLHPRLVEALKTGNKKQAKALMTEHISGARSLALEALTQSTNLQTVNLAAPNRIKRK